MCPSWARRSLRVLPVGKAGIYTVGFSLGRLDTEGTTILGGSTR